MRIDWDLPAHRPGIWGAIDKFIGPGATTAEKQLQLYIPFAFAFGIVIFGGLANVGWSLGQYVIIALLAVDMVGGVITNATSAAKRWYFRTGEGFRQHIIFIAIHLFQIVVFAWAFLELDLLWIAGVYATLMLSSVIILKTPLYLQRPVAATLYIVALLLSLYVFENPPYLEWFLPVLFYKILISHTLREEPYQPA
ncbi:MAG: hypothetical protein VX083_11595 [Pseudomonadota bacterium]|jgi:hypothetical protein|uniref:hypothetical protein n=1 Tax=Thalassovita sp. TaxID=1979401 RepID=UPI002AB1C8F5|nr:hypothetical protein [Thalassovita sp.]MEC8042885.1 hypothetical protein [Pseudomonadota bacterium]MEC8294133.1 hypothetical protein [Pseudomonadota bacterium]